MTEIGPAPGPNPGPAVVYDFSGARARLEAKRREQAADRTGFTDEALELARARAAVEEAPEVREAKVEALKGQVARGEYQADPRAIAARLLDQGL